MGTQPKPYINLAHWIMTYIKSFLVKLSGDMCMLLIDKDPTVEFKKCKSPTWKEEQMHGTTWVNLHSVS